MSMWFSILDSFSLTKLLVFSLFQQLCPSQILYPQLLRHQFSDSSEVLHIFWFALIWDFYFSYMYIWQLQSFWTLNSDWCSLCLQVLNLLSDLLEMLHYVHLTRRYVCDLYFLFGYLWQSYSSFRLWISIHKACTSKSYSHNSYIFHWIL